MYSRKSGPAQKEGRGDRKRGVANHRMCISHDSVIVKILIQPVMRKQIEIINSQGLCPTQLQKSFIIHWVYAQSLIQRELYHFYHGVSQNDREYCVYLFPLL